MIEILGNIWDYYKQDNNWIILPTNGTLNKEKRNVMGKGLAKEAKLLQPALPTELGFYLKNYGNHCFILYGYQIISCPTKLEWWNPSTLDLVEQSCKELSFLLPMLNKQMEYWHKPDITGIYCPRLGCGNGGLNWDEVKPVIDNYIGKYVSIVNKEA